MILTKKNAKDVINVYCYALKMSDYNSECFSSSDVRRHMFAHRLFCSFAQLLEDNGYDARVILHPYLIKHDSADPDFVAIPDENLKQKIDKDIHIDMTKLEHYDAHIRHYNHYLAIWNHYHTATA